MDSEQMEVRLRAEVDRGKAAKIAYDKFIEEYVKEKVLTLFENFCDSNTMDGELLKDYRRLVTILRSLEGEILSIIETGKLAAQTLSELENRNGR